MMAASAAPEYGPRAGVLAPLPSCERGVAAVTAVSPDGKLLIYCNGANVVVRELARPALAYVYPEHAHAVKCAKFSPSGKYVASGDASGKVRIWAWTQAEHSLKFECPCGENVEDVSWDAESKRILAVGGGQNKASVFQFDTGSRLGEVVPHNKKAITGDLRPSRPYRMVTGSEDMSLQFYAGPPFKYVKGIKEHANFVNCVRFSPDGARFASVSSDKSGIVYHGETGDVLGKLAAEGGHAGGVLHCAWSPDSKRLVTSGGDKAVKVWDMAAAGAAEGGGPPYPCVATFVVGARPEDMQNSVCWADAATIVSTSLDGTLNVFNAADVGAGPVSRIEGHQAHANCLELDRASGNIYTGCAGGRLCVWRPLDEARTVYEAKVARGEVASKKAAAVCLSGGFVAIAAWDDKMRIGDAATGELQRTVALGAQPKGIAACALVPGVFVVATGAAVMAVRAADGAVLATVPCPWAPTCVDAAEGAPVVAVGGADKRVHVFALGADGSSLAEQGEPSKDAPAAISVVAVARDGATVAAGDAQREVRLYSTGGAKEALKTGKWMNHTTRVTGLKWSPSGKHLASVSTDRRLCIWSPDQDAAVLSMDLAGPQPFTACAWADENSLWLLGIDGVAVLKRVAL